MTLSAYPYNVVLADYDEDLFAPQGWEGELLAHAGAGWTIGQNRTEDSLLAASGDADVVMIQSVRPLLNRRVIAQLPRCRCIIRVGIGYDSVDVGAATDHGIVVCNVPEYCVEEVADHALALLLAGMRHITRLDQSIRHGRWDRAKAKPARRLRGSTLGLVAFGRTARALAEKVRGMGLRLLAFDPYVSADVAASYGVELVELDELLRRSDLISIHAPLSSSTFHLLGERQFALMRPGAVLANTSRGPLVDETALAKALRDGPLGAAGLDVFEQEPPPAESPLLQLDNVILTPHVAGYAEESVHDLYSGACQSAIDILQGRWPASAVNPEVRAHGLRFFEGLKEGPQI
jgi:D-3-phosphoglycerate dehydrogenase